VIIGVVVDVTIPSVVVVGGTTTEVVVGVSGVVVT
jgi:hypothetical protein